MESREISAGTVTNKSPQHDSLLLKHFIFPQHNGVLLPIICSVSARVDIKWGAAAFSCHFSAVFTLPWRPRCFLVSLPGKQEGVRWRGSKCCKGFRCQDGEWEEGQGPGPGECDRRKDSMKLCCHALLTPDKSAISKTRSIFQWP